jgi:hypothetical protein
MAWAAHPSSQALRAPEGRDLAGGKKTGEEVPEMRPEEFEKIVEERIAKCASTLDFKANEYATGDRLHNFKVAAALQAIEPETALLGMWSKHIVSVVDIIYKIEHRGEIPSKELLSEKITDVINYAFLLEALIEERRKAE